MAGGDPSDDVIEQDIRARLTWDPEIEGAVISVNVTKGIVILEGTVRGYQRAAAERIAKETPGVTAVDNRLRLIDPLHPPDETIGRLVNAALAADPLIPAEQISVAVHDGVVELSGEVSRGAERIAAEEAVLDLPGVVDVRNRIVVTDVPVQVGTDRDHHSGGLHVRGHGRCREDHHPGGRRPGHAHGNDSHVAPPPTRRAGCVECHGRKRGA